MKNFHIYLKKSLVMFTCFLLITQPPTAHAESSHEYTTTPKNTSPTSAGGSYQTNTFTGSFSYNISIDVAPGKLAPSLAISYNSQADNGWIGQGWGLGVGYIQRETVDGVPVAWNTNGTVQNRYDDNAGFNFSIGGQSSRLKRIGTTNVYRPEVESGSQLEFTFSGSTWTVTDKAGTQYTFAGNTTPDTMEHPTFTTTGGGNIFYWALTEIKDTNNNVAQYFYTRDNGQLYLDEIRYNQNVGTGSVFGPTHSVKFILEDRTNNGLPSTNISNYWDADINYRRGFKVETKKRLKEVQSKVGTTIAHRYVLSYSKSPSTNKSLLTCVEHYGSGTQKLPDISFEYTEQVMDFYPAVRWGNHHNQTTAQDNEYTWNTIRGAGAFNAASKYLDLVDITRDGLPDRLMRDQISPYDRYLVQRGGVTGWNQNDNPPLSITSVSSFTGTDIDRNDTYYFPTEVQIVRLLDLNRDGLLDRLHNPQFDQTPAGDLNYATAELGTVASGNITLSDQTNWGPIDTHTQPNTHAGYNSVGWVDPLTGGTVVSLEDMNGDGRPDRVMRPVANTGPYNTLRVQLNNGSGFDSVRIWNIQSAYQQDDPVYSFIADVDFGGNDTSYELLDINSDGLPDRVLYQQGNPAHNQFVVQYGNGYGFEPPVNWGTLEHPLGTPSGYVLDSFGLSFSATAGTYIGNSFSWSLTDTLMDDINGDGRPDRIMRTEDTTPGTYSSFSVQLNTGRGFSPRQPYTHVQKFTEYFDDGTPPAGLGILEYYVSPARNGFVFPRATLYRSCQLCNPDIFEYGEYVSLQDVNGDRLPDRLLRDDRGTNLWDNNGYYVQLARGPFPDLLKTVHNGMGGKVDLTYKPSTAYDNTDGTHNYGMLNQIFYVVDTLTTDDGMNRPESASTITYDYKYGKYDFYRREFNGFNCVSTVDQDGIKSTSYFYQGGGINDSINGEYEDTVPGAFAKQGIAYRTVLEDINANRYSEIYNRIKVQDLGSGRYFPYSDRVVTFSYPGNVLTNYRATATETDYNTTTGNITEIRTLGRVTNFSPSTYTYTNYTNTDDKKVATIYHVFATHPLWKNFPERQTTSALGDSTSKLQETVYEYYDTDSNLNNDSLLKKKKSWLNTNDTYIEELYGYDSYGNNIQTTNPLNVVNQIQVDPVYHFFQEYVIQDYGGKNFTTHFTHDPLSGKILTTTTLTGTMETNYYDELYRLTRKTVTPLGEAEIWLEQNDYRTDSADIEHDPNYIYHRANDFVDANGLESYDYIDGFGRRIQTRSEAETANIYRVTDNVYNKQGSVIFQSHPYFDTGSSYNPMPVSSVGTTTVYDSINRLDRIVPPTGETNSPTGTTQTKYSINNVDPWGTEVTNAKGQIKKTQTDAFGRTIAVSEYLGATPLVTTYTYDRLNNPKTISDPGTVNTIQFTYDSLGRKLNITDPDMGHWDYLYDAGGHLTQQIDAKRQKIETLYDHLDRVYVKKIFANENDITPIDTISYLYDTNLGDSAYPVHNGELYKVVDKMGWVKFGYDNQGRVIKKTRHLNINNKDYTFQYVFNGVGFLTDIIYPQNLAQIHYEKDRAGHLVNIMAIKGTDIPNEILYTGDQFNEIGQIKRKTYGNNVRTDLNYYTNSKRLSSIIAQNLSTSQTYQNLQYRYDPLGNLTELNDILSTQPDESDSLLFPIVYDDLNRITEVNRNGQHYYFGYTNTGNLNLNTEIDLGAYVYADVRPHAVSSAFGKNYTYDLNGNMITRGNQTLIYNEENQLIEVQEPGKPTVTFGYDYAGTRLWMKVGSSDLTVWIDDLYEEKAGRKLIHVKADGYRFCMFQPKETYHTLIPYLLFPPSGTHININPVLRQKNVFYYFHKDPILSTDIVTDKQGRLIQNYGYHIFGNERYIKDPSLFLETEHFTDQDFDRATGLYYFGSRYYDPKLGRFLQPDTIIPDIHSSQSLNRYTYVFNNPLKYTDPSGHLPQDPALPNYDSQNCGACHISLAYDESEKPVNSFPRSFEETTLGQMKAEAYKISMNILGERTFLGGFGSAMPEGYLLTADQELSKQSAMVALIKADTYLLLGTTGLTAVESIAANVAARSAAALTLAPSHTNLTSLPSGRLLGNGNPIPSGAWSFGLGNRTLQMAEEAGAKFVIRDIPTTLRGVELTSTAQSRIGLYQSYLSGKPTYFNLAGLDLNAVTETSHQFFSRVTPYELRHVLGSGIQQNVIFHVGNDVMPRQANYTIEQLKQFVASTVKP